MVATARTSPPDLNDASKYVVVRDVPIVDTHLRKHFDPETGEPFVTVVDEDQLEVIADNTNERLRNGEIPAVRPGHIVKELPEHKQPPVVGYMKDFKVGEYLDKPTILADLYMKRSAKIDGNTYTHDEVLENFPRRSIEVFHKTDPDGYIDALALLVRAPARDLGLVTYAKSDEVEIFQCVDKSCKGENMADEDEGEDLELEENETQDESDSAVRDREGDAGADAGATGNKSISHLAKALGRKLAQDIEFHGSLGTAMSNNPDFLKNLAIVIGEVLEGASESDQMGGGAEQMDDDGNGMDTPNPETQPEMDTEQSTSEAYSEGTPSGTNTVPPSPQTQPTTNRRGAEYMSKDNKQAPVGDERLVSALIAKDAQIKALTTQNKSLTTQISDLTTRMSGMEMYQKELADQRKHNDRLSRLETLRRDGFEFDVTEEMEHYGKVLDDDGFERHIKRIPTNYKRSLNGARPVEVADSRGDRDGLEYYQQIGEEDSPGIELYSRDHPIKSGESQRAYGDRVLREYVEAKKAKRAAR